MKLLDEIDDYVELKKEIYWDATRSNALSSHIDGEMSRFLWWDIYLVKSGILL